VILDHERRVVFADRFNRLDWNFQINRVKGTLDRYNHARVLVDSTGAGEPILESMRREGVNAIPYPFTAKSKNALIDNLSLMLEQRLLVLPKADIWPDGIDELESFEFSVTESGNVRTSAPVGCHDDVVIGLALAAWHLRPNRPVPRIRRIC
jgi:hypothetical protein